jgi:hypothetical protein
LVAVVLAHQRLRLLMVEQVATQYFQLLHHRVVVAVVLKMLSELVVVQAVAVIIKRLAVLELQIKDLLAAQVAQLLLHKEHQEAEAVVLAQLELNPRIMIMVALVVMA